MHPISLRSLAFMALAACLVAGCEATGATAAGEQKIAAPVAAALSRLEAGQALDPHVARSDAQGRLEVYVYVTEVSASTVQALAALGLKDATPSPMGLVQGWIAPGDMSALAASPLVTRIGLPRYARHQ